MTTRDLPKAENLPVNHLVTTLKNTTASYKFYWFLAILDSIRDEIPSPISFEYLISRMITLAWYPNLFFKLSFGKADQLARTVLSLKEHAGLNSNAKPADIVTAAMRSFADVSKSGIYSELWSKAKYVPYRFLSPWFASELKALGEAELNTKIASLADKHFQNHKNLPIYRFVGDGKQIELQPRWRGYMQRHLTIVQSFVDWYLVQYVQRLNPNVPGLPNKLFAPEVRNLKPAREFWTLAGPTKCIYTGQAINVDQAELDHFLPWSFVTHDLLWNVIPVAPKANTAKSDSLPNLSRYLIPFAKAQYAAVRKVAGIDSGRGDKVIEDYQNLISGQTGKSFGDLDENEFIAVLAQTIKPQYEIARNMGFQPNWTYT